MNDRKSSKVRAGGIAVTRILLRRRLVRLCAIGIVALLTTVPACAKKLKVAASILPLADFVRNIVGDSLEVLVMVPPGSNPETYEPSPMQLAELAGVNAYVKIGADFEFEKSLVDKIAKMYPKLKIIDCSAGIELITDNYHEHELSPATPAGHTHGGHDPHIWNSPRNARIMVRNIAAGIATVDPADSAAYRGNAAVYDGRLDSLDRFLESLLRPYRGAKFIVFHPAWGYFARDYGLIQIAVEKEGKEPSISETIKLIKMARADNLKTIFVSPQFNRENAAAVAREIDGVIETADPLADDFIGQMIRFGEKLARSFRDSIRR